MLSGAPKNGRPDNQKGERHSIEVACSKNHKLNKKSEHDSLKCLLDRALTTQLLGIGESLRCPNGSDMLIEYCQALPSLSSPGSMSEGSENKLNLEEKLKKARRS